MWCKLRSKNEIRILVMRKQSHYFRRLRNEEYRDLLNKVCYFNRISCGKSPRDGRGIRLRHAILSKRSVISGFPFIHKAAKRCECCWLVMTELHTTRIAYHTHMHKTYRNFLIQFQMTISSAYEEHINYKFMCVFFLLPIHVWVCELQDFYERKPVSSKGFKCYHFVDSG